MATAASLLREKNDALASLNPRATVLDAARLMNEHHIGSVLVCEDDRLVGIFTERDVMRRVVAAGLEPHRTRLDQVMTTPVAYATPDTLLDEIRAVMRERRIRHLPVLDHDEQVVGMISIGDLNKADHEVHARTIQYLEQYMSVP